MIRIEHQENIIKLCIKGNDEGFRLLYSTFGPTLLGIAFRYSKDKHEAEDILQEAFIKIFNKISSYKSSGSFEGWLKRIVINTALNKVHKNKSLREDNLEDRFVEQYSDSNSDFDNDYLYLCLNKLPSGYRTIFNLFAIDGYSHKEIAKLHGITEGTSKSQFSKAKAALKTIININELIL